MKKNVVLVVLLLAVLLLTLPPQASAEEPTTIPTPSSIGDFECDKECQPDKAMKTLIEGKVANIGCLQTCLQRKVWEKLSTSIADVADSLKKNSYKEIMVPMENKMEELKTQVDSLEKKLDNLKPAEKETPLIK